MLAYAEQADRQRGVQTLYLLTAAAAFFTQRGYVRIPCENAPPALHQTAEFAALCPASAVRPTKARDSPLA